MTSNSENGQNSTLKKVYRIEVFYFIPIHLNVCNMLLNLINILIRSLYIFRFILIMLHLLTSKSLFHLFPLGTQTNNAKPTYYLLS